MIRKRNDGQKDLRYNHGKYGSPAYSSYHSMMNRCRNKKNNRFKHYGGRGISVSKEWKTFEKFYEDMGDRPEGTSLDRIDNSKGYSKENCRWATNIQQASNRRTVIFLTFKNKTLSLKAWSRELGMRYLTLYGRVKNGWTIEEAFQTPVRNRGR
jgi:hypothetical protein